MDEDLEFLHTGFGANASAEKTLNILYGVLLGFIADGVIQDEEKEYLKKKRREHDEERAVKRLRPVFTAIDKCLVNDRLTVEDVIGILKIIDETGSFKTDYRPETIDTQLLLGVCNGIIADGKITREEISLLLHTLESNSRAEISSEWRACLGKISALFNASQTISRELLDELRGHIKDFVCCPAADDLPVEFEDNLFVLSGQFALGRKKDVAELIEDRGGLVVSGVSMKTRYVVVGGTRSILWKYDVYGTKVARAKELKESGCLIDVISESNLSHALE